MSLSYPASAVSASSQVAAARVAMFRHGTRAKVKSSCSHVPIIATLQPRLRKALAQPPILSNSIEPVSSKRAPCCGAPFHLAHGLIAH